MKTTRWLLAGAVAALLVLPPARAVQADRSARRAETESGVLRLGWVNTDLWLPSTLDPAVDSSDFVFDLYSGLVKLDDHWRVVPDLAQSLPALSADHLTYTFTLRPGLRFSDGTPLTSQDVACSISRALSQAERSPTASPYLGHIKGATAWTAGKAPSLAGIAAPDARTVRITLDRPVTYFLPALAYPTSYVVKKGLAPGINLAAPHAQALTIGSGPFMFGRPWRYRQELYMVPNPHWYGASHVKLKELRYRFYADTLAQFRGYQAGQIDFVWGVPDALLDSYRRSHDLHYALTLGLDFLSPNVGTDALCKPAHCAPFNDLHFRRALLYAVDRQLIGRITHGYDVPLCGLIPRGVLGYDPSLCSLAPYDPARARAELALAKKDFGGAIPHDGSNTLVCRSDIPQLSHEFVALQQMWARVGIQIAIQTVPSNTWWSLLSRNSTPFLEDVWWGDYPDPQDYAENLLTKSSAFDVVNYDNPTYARLIKEGDTTADPAARARIYIQAQRLALEDAAFIPIGQWALYFLWKPSIHGLSVSGGTTDYTNVGVS